MSRIFKPPKVPDVPVIEVPVYTPPAAAEPEPEPEVKEIKEIEEETEEKEKKKIQKGATRKKTILTGPRGILSAPVVKFKTLLGE